MLKKLTLCAVAVAFAVAVAGPAQAQITKKISYDAGIGLALPMGDLGDISTMGLTVGVDGFYGTLDAVPGLQVGGRLAYNNFGSEDAGAGVSSDASIIEIVPTVRYALPSQGKLGYFLQGGLGLYFKSVSVDAPGTFFDADDSETDLGITIGGGVTYPLSNGMTVAAVPLLHLTGDNYLTINAVVLFGEK